MSGLLGGSVSERRLARSVAHRLKYYIDVQRKEDSFDSSGVISDMDECLYSNPTCLTKQEDNKEHNFAKIKLEASLRAYMGSAEECNRKAQKSPEKQKDLEKLIKKMARDYVPDRMKEGKAKRQRKLHVTATPSMSPEDVRRLVSSASKLIVAATSEVSPEELGTTQENGSSPKRREVKSVLSLDNSSKQCFSSTRSNEDEARRAKQNQERKNAKYLKSSSETLNISSNSAKSKRFFAQPLPKLTDGSSVNINSIAPYMQTGQNEMIRKGILKSRTSPSCTSSAISEHQDKLPNTQWKTFSPCQHITKNSGGRSCKPFKIKRQELSYRPAETVSSKSCRPSKCLDTRPILSSRNNQEVKGNNIKHSATPTVEGISMQHSMAGEKTRKQYNSTAISGGAILKEQGNQVHDQKSILVENTVSPQKNEQDGCDSASKRTPESHQVHFQKLREGYIPAITDWGCHCLESCCLHNLRGPEEATLPAATVDQSTGLVACVQEDHNHDCIPMVKRGSSFLYDVCQEMSRDAPASLTRNGAMTIDGDGGDRSTRPLLNQQFSLNEPGDSHATEGPASSTLILGESCYPHVIYIPPTTRPGGCRCSGLPSYCVCGTAEEQGSESAVTTTAISERSESEQSEEEFTISSASSTSSAGSLISLREQMSGNAKEEGNSSSSIEVVLQKDLKAPLENSITQKEMSCQHSEKQRSPDEKRTDMDHATEGVCTSQIVYFSHFPKSI